MPSRILAVALLVLLAACSMAGPSTPPAPRPLDPLDDDVGALLVAFDLPRGLGPVAGAQSLTYAPAGGKTLAVTLTPADADEIATNFPPPPEGHAYYLFAFAPADIALVRAAQAAVETAATRPQVLVTVAPRLCTSGGIDPATAVISILVALPGGPHLRPLVDHRALGDLLGPAVRLPACR